ncbi:MAG: DinB family protein [Anaerolineales bacterium]
MKSDMLSSVVEDFCRIFVSLPDSELERAWKWKDHDEEGIRFALFVTLQELRQLAVTLSTLLPKPTAAQHILSQYHAAYMDLQAAILGLSPDEADQEFAQGEWSPRRVYAHILATDLGFTAVVRYALEGHRNGTWKQDPLPESDEPRLTGISGMTEEEYQALVKGPFEKMLAYHREFHPIILKEFNSITDAELDLPSTFWEETRFPIRHRLHRYEAHYVQHTIQMDKTLVAFEQAPNESKRLVRKIYAALAEAEGLLIGAGEIDDTAIQATASSIQERTDEITGLLK